MMAALNFTTCRRGAIRSAFGRRSWDSARWKIFRWQMAIPQTSSFSTNPKSPERTSEQGAPSVSESILDHGYLPEEHAPDPVISHGDPTPPGKVAIWLFLASEIMFFIAILGTYIILRSGSPSLFAKHAEVLSKALAGVNTVVLIFSSLTMALAVDASQKGNRERTMLFLAITIACAFGFMGIKAKEYYDKGVHHTMTVVDPSSPAGVWVYDGHAHRHGQEWEFDGSRMPLPQHGQFDIHLVSEASIEEAHDHKE